MKLNQAQTRTFQNYLAARLKNEPLLKQEADQLVASSSSAGSLDVEGFLNRVSESSMDSTQLKSLFDSYHEALILLFGGNKRLLAEYSVQVKKLEDDLGIRDALIEKGAIQRDESTILEQVMASKLGPEQTRIHELEAYVRTIQDQRTQLLAYTQDLEAELEALRGQLAALQLREQAAHTQRAEHEAYIARYLPKDLEINSTPTE